MITVGCFFSKAFTLANNADGAYEIGILNTCCVCQGTDIPNIKCSFYVTATCFQCEIIWKHLSRKR